MCALSVQDGRLDVLDRLISATGEKPATLPYDPVGRVLKKVPNDQTGRSIGSTFARKASVTPIGATQQVLRFDGHCPMGSA